MLFRDLPGVTTCRFKQGEYLLRRGEPMPYVYYLKKGEVKREVLTPYGSEMINTIKVGGQITGSIVGLLEIYDSRFMVIAAMILSRSRIVCAIGCRWRYVCAILASIRSCWRRR